MLKSFDVSAYQGNTVPVCDVAFVKATESTNYKSSKFAAQWASAKKNAKVRGAYHFARPEASSGTVQADYFLALVKPEAGDLLVLDLEVSKKTQTETNKFAIDFAARCKEKFPDNKRVVYMGSGYASNGTGKGLSSHYDYWWYPQYPSTANTSTWKTSFSPWLPSGLTCGWKAPHFWQFTDNFGGLDASISTLSLSDLTGQVTPTPPPAPKPKAWPKTYYRVTSPLMHGTNVKWIQDRLNAHGAKPVLEDDGEYGTKTRDAVEVFQKAHGLTKDGVVGEITWTALGK